MKIDDLISKLLEYKEDGCKGNIGISLSDNDKSYIVQDITYEYDTLEMNTEGLVIKAIPIDEYIDSSLKNESELLDGIITELLVLDGNETNLLNNLEDYSKFKMLVIELMKIKYDIRWCSNNACQCHPETSVKSILKDNPNLYEFLKKHSSIDDIKPMLNVYKNTTVFDKGYIK